MVKLPMKSKRTFSSASSAAIGVAAALVISFALTALLTSLLLNELLKENAADICIFAVRTIAVMIGGFVAAALAKNKYLPVIGAVVAVYLVILTAITIVVFDGLFGKIGSGIISAVIGGAIACIIKLKPQRKRKTRVRI